MAPNTSTSHGTPSQPTPVSKHPKDGAQRPSSLDPNVLEVVFGTLLIKPWYPSFYPEELVGRRIERLYVCQWCFKYSKELMGFLGHLGCCCGQPIRRDGKLGGGEEGNGSRNGGGRSKRDRNANGKSKGQGDGNGKAKDGAGTTKGMPGEEIYTDSARGISIWEIDGEEHKLYAQNLSLFAKLFLDTKSVFYDVTTFLYYVLVAHDPEPAIHTGVASGAHGQTQTQGQAQENSGKKTGQVVGFFSKEKMSWDNNNLACILIFPPWQKQGLGQILMGASYEMSKREGRLGGPEKRTYRFLLAYLLARS
jgi:GNAT superfamily N-acetyltransferase